MAIYCKTAMIDHPFISFCLICCDIACLQIFFFLSELVERAWLLKIDKIISKDVFERRSPTQVDFLHIWAVVLLIIFRANRL